MAAELVSCCETDPLEKYYRIRAHHLGDFWWLYNLARLSQNNEQTAIQEAEALFRFNYGDDESYKEVYTEFLGLKDLSPEELQWVLINNDYNDVDILGSPEAAQEFVGNQASVNLRFLNLGESDLVAVTHGPDEICDNLTGDGSHCVMPEDNSTCDYNYDISMMYSIIKYYTDHIDLFKHRVKPKIISVIENGRSSFAFELSAGLILDIFDSVPYSAKDKNTWVTFDNFIGDKSKYESRQGLPPRDFELYRHTVWVKCVNLLLAIPDDF